MAFYSPVNDFKKWMKEHPDGSESDFDKPKRNKNFIGVVVESKVKLRKLLSKMQPESGNLNELAMDFVNNNGIISNIDGKVFLIEVDSGEFYIERHYVRRA